MLIRISLGMFFYVLVSSLFGKSFNFYQLGLSMLFVLLPLADWLPYLAIRKRYKLVSHYLWYYPPVYVPVGAVITWYISANWYYVALFVVNSLANFVHATFQTRQGLKWIPRLSFTSKWLLSWTSISLYGGKLRVFSADEREAFLEALREELEVRSKKRGHEDGMRTVEEELADRRHPKGSKTIAFLAISIVLLIFFYGISIIKIK